MTKPGSVAADWEPYWRGSANSAALQSELQLDELWAGLFGQLQNGSKPTSLLDVACGNGAVTRMALQTWPGLVSSGLDLSPAALREYGSRYPAATGVVGDSLSMPFVDSSFDLVVSQFGFEYAGLGALEEMLRLVAPDGSIIAIMHLRDGAIYRECALNLDVVEELRRLRVMELTRLAFIAGFALNAGRGKVAEFRKAEADFVPAIRGLEQLLNKYGSNTADGLLRQLHGDISQMYRQMSAYAEEDVMAWIKGMETELQAYSGRMQAMLTAAVGDAQFQQWCERAQALGFKLERKEKIALAAKTENAAWMLTARPV
jgi:SAM-dependent methyltransferase